MIFGRIETGLWFAALKNGYTLALLLVMTWEEVPPFWLPMALIPRASSSKCNKRSRCMFVRASDDGGWHGVRCRDDDDGRSAAVATHGIAVLRRGTFTIRVERMRIHSSSATWSWTMLLMFMFSCRSEREWWLQCQTRHCRWMSSARVMPQLLKIVRKTTATGLQVSHQLFLSYDRRMTTTGCFQYKTCVQQYGAAIFANTSPVGRSLVKGPVHTRSVTDPPFS